MPRGEIPNSQTTHFRRVQNRCFARSSRGACKRTPPRCSLLNPKRYAFTYPAAPTLATRRKKDIGSSSSQTNRNVAKESSRNSKSSTGPSRAVLGVSKTSTGREKPFHAEAGSSPGTINLRSRNHPRKRSEKQRALEKEMRKIHGGQKRSQMQGNRGKDPEKRFTSRHKKRAQPHRSCHRSRSKVPFHASQSRKSPCYFKDAT